MLTALVANGRADAANKLVDLIVELLQIVPYFAVLLVLLIVSWFALRLIRAHLEKTELTPADYLESFQKMREEGKLSEEEFRIIRGLVSLQTSRSPNGQNPEFTS